MAKRTAVTGQAQKILAGRGVGKKKDVVVQAEADAVKAELSGEAHSVDVSKVAPTSAGLGDGGLFSAMVASAAASGEAAGQAAGGSGAATAATGGGISTGLLVAGGIGILGGVAAAAGGGGKSNKAPVFAAAEVAVAVDEDKPLSNSVKATDGNNDPLTYAVGTQPANGSVTVSADGSYVYTPKANYNGADSFTVTASDGKGGSATQTVKVTVNSVNDAPAFAAAEVTPAAINEDSSLSGTVGATDVESDALTYAVGTRPTNGSVTVNANGSYVYTPNANYNGADSFTVTASDGKGGSATQTVKVTVNSVNDAPAFAAAEVTPAAIAEDSNLVGTVRATDVESDALTYAVGTRPTNGSVTVNADGSYVYTPRANYSGADSFTVTVSDGKGGSATQTVKLTINPVNDAPVVSGPVTGSASEDGAAVTLDGLANASDVDTGAVLSIVNVGTLPAGVTRSGNNFTLDAANAAYQSLAAGQTATVTVNYSVSDGTATTPALAVFTVTGTNDAPVITSTAQAGAVAEDGTLSATGTVASSDVDVTGKTATYTGSKAGTYGTFTIDAATGAWKYDLSNSAAVVQALAEGEPKTETFAVTVTDDKNATVTQNVVVTVTGSNDRPTIAATTTATGTVKEDATLSATGTVASSDVDVTGKTATYTGSAVGTYGAFSINSSTGAWKYDLDNASHQNLDGGETQTEVFTVTVTDDKGETATQNVTVSVTGTNDLPVVSAISDRSVSFQEAAPTATLPTTKFVNVAGTDADGGVVTFTVPASTAVANITLASDGSGFTYTPKDINYHGTETITVRLNDAQGAGNFTEYQVQVTVLPNTAENQGIDNGPTLTTYNAAGSGLTAGDNFTFIDDSAQSTNVEITNFQLGDKIQVSASASNYSFAVTGSGDLEITYTASGVSNVILLKGVAVNAGFIDDEATAEAQLGLGNFFLSLGDGATNAYGTAVVGTSLDLDSDSNVNTFALFNATAGNIAYVEDANVANRSLIQGFGTGDTITVSNAAISAYSFSRDTNAGNDIVITYNNGGAINEIVLQGAATGSSGILDTLAAVEALLGVGFFNAISGGSGGSGGSSGGFTPTATTVADNASGKATFNAGTGSIQFTDDANVRSDVILQNFGSNDRIVTNSLASNYNFAISEDDADDLVITFNNNGVLNQFVLDEILAGKDAFIDNYASAVTAVGFDFMTFG